MLLGRPVADRDYAFAGSVEEFLSVHTQARPVGKSHQVFMHGLGQFSPLRGPDIQADLMARDLTINALALDSRGHLHAHPLAESDLRNKILRPCRPTSLSDDPLRVYRAARFAASLPDFNAHPDLLAAMSALAGSEQLARISSKRLAGETLKALDSPAPGRFIALLHRAACLEPWFGPLLEDQGKRLDETVAVMNQAAGQPLLVWLALCAHLASPAELADQPDKEAAGRAGRLARRLDLPARHALAGQSLGWWQPLLNNYAKLVPESKVRLLYDLDRKDLTGLAADLVGLMSGQDIYERLRLDTAKIKAVRLPLAQQNLGETSGRILSRLRAAALT